MREHCLSEFDFHDPYIKKIFISVLPDQSKTSKTIEKSRLVDAEINLIQVAVIKKDLAKVKVIMKLAQKDTEKLLKSKIECKGCGGLKLSQKTSWILNATVIHLAAHWHVESLAHFLQIKPELCNIKAEGSLFTPLHVAASVEDGMDAINLLLQRDANTDATDESGQTPLHVAAQNNHADCIKTLLEGGAMVDPLYCPKKRETPLHVACAHGFYQSAAVLLDYKADPDAANGQGETSLHLACKGLQSDLINLLLEHDATITARDDEDRTPLHFL